MDFTTDFGKDGESTPDSSGQILEELREKQRKELDIIRETQREFALQKARFLDIQEKVEDFSESDIADLAKKLKTKSQVSCELLRIITNILLENESNISAFLKVDGALQALLRLLSGQNEKYQLLAAQCLCNLALGNEKESYQVLKTSESYLIMHLSGKNFFVMETCILALGNFCHQSLKNIKLLMKQNFFSKALHLLTYNNLSLESAAIYALTQFIYYGYDIVGVEILESCFLSILPVFKKRCFSVAFLMSVVSFCKSVHHYFVSNNIHVESLNILLIALKDNEKEAVYFLRILSNLINEETGNVIVNIIQNHCNLMRECVSLLLQSEKNYLRNECFAMLGKITSHSAESVKAFGLELVKENALLVERHMNKHKNVFEDSDMS